MEDFFYTRFYCRLNSTYFEKNYGMRQLFFYAGLFISISTSAQITGFEKSGGTETATYFEAIKWYKDIEKTSPLIKIKEMGPTDAGYPLHLVMLSGDSNFDPVLWHKKNKVVILINNGIHPGEPDGIDASMMLVRDIIKKKVMLPPNVALAFIPVYNIGGSLNRNSYTRANQNGPVAYGFRGNAQNLDLNRDFTKADSKNARSFSEIFHYLQPDIQVDNHVSDGADFQHTMTLIATQYDKLGITLGTWLKDKFEPALYKKMHEKGWDMVPYVDFETTDFDKGMQMFMDPPRYSSGYAALFNTISFMPETHMLKPYKDRVRSTYDLMQSFIEEASTAATSIKQLRTASAKEWQERQTYPLKWTIDKSNYSEVAFSGYETRDMPSEATGLSKMIFDHNQPFTKKVKFYNHFISGAEVKKPRGYIIPQGWFEVIDRLKLNKVQMNALKQDSTIQVEAYQIEDLKSYPNAYEKHHKNYDVKLSTLQKKVQFLKGDYIIYLNQPAQRYIIEMLEPGGDDSFFAWNFFDAILQQKEGYSDYRWEDIAADILRKDPVLQKKLEEKKASDTVFAANSRSILNYIYRNSPWFEKAYRAYPVYRLM